MPKEESNKRVTQALVPVTPHGLRLEGRERMAVTGVRDVSGFDESTVLLQTDLGELSIHGEQLHIDRIDLENGNVEVRGKVRELSYDEQARGGFLSRLFG